MDEANFNITNRLGFVRNGAGYEIEYSIHPRGMKEKFWDGTRFMEVLREYFLLKEFF